MKILNLYAGIGGNRKLWGDEHEITAVEYKPEIAAIYSDMFPDDTVLVEDAHEYLLNHYHEYDFIWSSPPCPTHSKARYGLGFHGGKVDAVYPDMRLYQEIILLKHHFKGKWIIENVMAYYKPLITPVKLGRHWFWSNFTLSTDIILPPSHVSQQSKKYSNKSKKYSNSAVKSYKASDYEKSLGYDLSKYKISNKRLLLRNCVEPELGAFVLKYAQDPYKINAELFTPNP